MPNDITCLRCKQSGFHWGTSYEPGMAYGKRAMLDSNDNVHFWLDENGKAQGQTCVASQPSQAYEITPAITPQQLDNLTKTVIDAHDSAERAQTLSVSVATEFASLGAKFEALKAQHEQLDATWTQKLNATQKVEITVKQPSGETISLGRQHKDFPKLLRRVQSTQGKGIVFMTGEPGSGKTHIVEAVAKALEVPFWVVSMNNQMSRSELLGYMNGSGEYVPTPAYWAAKSGGLVLYDELDASNANGLTGLNSLSSNEYITFPNGETVKKHPKCYIIAAGNTIGAGSNPMFIGRNQLDMASRTRFNYIQWDTDWGLVADLVSKRLGSPSWALKVKQLHDIVVKRNIQFVVSSRVALTGAEMLADGETEQDVLDSMVWPNLSEDEKEAVMGELRQPIAPKGV